MDTVFILVQVGTDPMEIVSLFKFNKHFFLQHFLIAVVQSLSSFLYSFKIHRNTLPNKLGTFNTIFNNENLQ